MQLQNFKSLLIRYIQQKNANVDFNTNQKAVHASYVELLPLDLVLQLATSQVFCNGQGV